MLGVTGKILDQEIEKYKRYLRIRNAVSQIQEDSSLYSPDPLPDPETEKVLLKAAKKINYYK
jgi:hypothetical protein